jgi:hypothetical protein
MTTRDIDAFAAAMLGGEPFIETIPDLELAPSPVQGRGMFAKRVFATGEMLCRLDGQLVDITRHPAVIDALEWNALSPECLLVRALRTSYGFINHDGAQPNVSIDADGRTMRACRRIAPGDELTMDYFAQPVPAAYLASDEAAALRRSFS